MTTVVKVFAGVLLMYFNTCSTDHVVAYLGKAGLSTNTPFMNLVIPSYLLMSMLLHVFRKVLIADLAVPRDLYCIKIRQEL